ncbi:hypothetical protein, partial [Leuconostoc lactis]
AFDIDIDETGKITGLF